MYTYGDCFPTDSETQEKIEEVLKNAPNTIIPVLNKTSFYKPSTLHMLSIFPGILGIDCFMLKDFKRGFLKYFTFGGLGMLWYKDIQTAKKRCRQYNYQKFMQLMSAPEEAIQAAMQDESNETQIDRGVSIAKKVSKGDNKTQSSFFSD